MVATVSIVALLLVLLAVPDFPADHRPLTSPLVVVSLSIAGILVAATPLTLIRPREPARAWLWVSVTCYVILLTLEPFVLVGRLPTGSTPWLLALSLIAFGSIAVAEPRPIRAGLLCAGLDVALTTVYAGRIPVGHSIIDAVGQGLLAVSLIAGVRILRARAQHADQAEHDAQVLFEEQRRQEALEKERTHTDALLHDSVLATFLAAAGHDAPDRATNMAQTALRIITTSEDHPAMRPATVKLADALASAEPEFAPFRKHAAIDFAAAPDIDVPPDVADALVSATLQALSNSVKHTGTSTHRTAVATPSGAGVCVRIADDGIGFDPARINQERLGVRVSILERVRQTGARAEIRSSPGTGTTVLLQWQPPTRGSETSRVGVPHLNFVPRLHLSRVLAVLIAAAILTAISETVLVSRAIGPLVAAVLGLAILPALLRGARTGTMGRRTAWTVAAAGILLCCTATIGLNPATADAVSLYWYTCGVLAGAVMVWMTGHKAPPLAAIAFQVTQITLWAGPTAAIRLGLATEIVLVIAGLIMHRAIRRINAAADTAARHHADLTIQHSDLAAFHEERQQRLRHASTTAAPMLRHIIARHGILDTAARAECRVLEQALRDEIRGRALLNDAVRNIVSAHRRRGASVQILDDGGLEDIQPDILDALLDDTARQLQSLQSTRIIIRTGQPDSDTAITIVATTPDETAAALGIDTDDQIDLWATIPRPATTMSFAA